MLPLLFGFFQKKRKTHQEITEEDVNKVPHSFVMHKGEVGKSVLQLEMDIRHVMEPYTATKLKVYRKIIIKLWGLQSAEYGRTGQNLVPAELILAVCTVFSKSAVGRRIRRQLFDLRRLLSLR